MNNRHVFVLALSLIVIGIVVMLISAATRELTGLGYQGVDIVLDRDMGPLTLGLNARPGLNIQIANKAGLQPRLDKVDLAKGSLTSAADRVRFAQAQFAP